MIFDFTQGESAFALEALPDKGFPDPMVIMAAGAAVILLLWGIVIKKRRAKKNETAGAE